MVDGEVTGRCSSDLTIMEKLPSSTLVETFVSAELEDTVMCILQEESGPCPEAILLFLDCSSFVFVFLPFPEEQLFESALWNSGKVKEAE